MTAALWSIFGALVLAICVLGWLALLLYILVSRQSARTLELLGEQSRQLFAMKTGQEPPGLPQGRPVSFPFDLPPTSMEDERHVGG